MSDLKSAIDRIEKALRSRYNVLALDGELAVAVTEAREGRLDALTATLEGRALYQHAAPIAEAMADAEAALVGGPEPEAARRKRVLSDLRLDELLDLAKANDIAVEPVSYTHLTLPTNREV